MPSHRRPALAAGLAMLFALASSAFVAPAGAATGRAHPAAGSGSLAWQPCGDADCARLEVPLDEARPDSPTIGIALLRVRATDPQHRIGSLVVNPGGPGAPGRSFARVIAGALPEAVRARFDVVGFDPRGVGRSTAVECGDDLSGFYGADFSPDTPAEWDALVRASRALVHACEARSGDLLPYVSTERAAGDLDRIRAALGDDRLTYLGFSYGTYLGARYAERFPERVRALVLDGGIDPALGASDMQVQQAVGFERALRIFLRDCADRSSCSFHGDGHPGRAYDRLRRRVDREPIPALPGRPLDGTLLDIGVTQALYGGRAEWDALADALRDAVGGDGSALVHLADQYTGRGADGSYDDVTDAFFAIGCPDGPPVGGVAGLRAIAARARRLAPRLGASIVNNSMPCAVWPLPAAPAAPVRAAGSPPIVVVGTRNDPATPLAWARGLAGELESGRLVTAPGEQHTAVANGNPCVDAVVARYLVDLLPPADPTRC